MCRKRVVLVLLLAIIALPSCLGQETQPYVDLVNSNTRFAFKLFRAVGAKKPQKNVLLSPISLSQDFALLQNGADPAAREQILSLFEYGGASSEEINRQAMALRQALIYDAPLKSASKSASATHRKREIEPPPVCCALPPEHLTLASSLWASPPVQFQTRFLEINKKFYSFHLASLPNKGPAATTAVNEWVARQTGGWLTHALDSWQGNDFLLADTTWFKGAWVKPFYPTQTQPADFTLPSGQKKQILMMSQGGDFSYLRGPKFQAVRLPYGHAAMYVFLPDLDSSLEEFQQSLTAENWTTWLSQLSSREGYLKLPRFRTGDTEHLAEILHGMGIDRSFDSFGAYRPLVENPEGARLTRVFQAVSIKVDENGTEAVSATFTGGVIGGIPAVLGQNPFV